MSGQVHWVTTLHISDCYCVIRHFWSVNMKQQERQGRLSVNLSCLSEHVWRYWVYEFVSNKKENYSKRNNFNAVGIG